MSRLWVSVLRIFMMRTMAASIWYCRSWKTRSSVAFCSSFCQKKKPQKNIHRFDWPRLKKKAKLEAVSKRRKTHGLFELDLVDFDAAQFEGEVAVVGELVAVADVLAAWRLLQHPRLAARQRLQRPPQLGVLFQRSTSNNNISSSRQSHFSIQLVL